MPTGKRRRSCCGLVIVTLITASTRCFGHQELAIIQSKDGHFDWMIFCPNLIFRGIGYFIVSFQDLPSLENMKT